MFPNLSWVLSEMKISQLTLADHLKISGPSLTRKMQGRAVFTELEKVRVSEYVGYDSSWLFARFSPPLSARRKAESVSAPAGA